MAKKTDPRDNAAQHARFIIAARQLGCNEDEAAFRDVLRKVAQHKPKDAPKPGKSPKRVKATNAGWEKRWGCAGRRRH